MVSLRKSCDGGCGVLHGRRLRHAHEHAGRPHPIGPARECRTIPNRRPRHPRTRPSPGLHPRTPPGSNQTQGNARSTKPRTSSRNAPPDGPPAGHTGVRSGPAASTHTAPWPAFPSAMRPWAPQHKALQRCKVTHDGTEQKRRRFYRPNAPPKSPPADQRIRRPRRIGGPPLSAICPWVPGSGGFAVHGRARTSSRTGAERPRTEPVGAVMLTVPPVFLL
jgi:hypothetical protein